MKYALLAFTFFITLTSSSHAFLCYDEWRDKRDDNGNLIYDENGVTVRVQVNKKCCFNPIYNEMAACGEGSINDQYKVSHFFYEYYRPLNKRLEINEKSCSYTVDDTVKRVFDKSIQKLTAAMIALQDTKENSDNLGTNNLLNEITKEYFLARSKTTSNFLPIQRNLIAKYQSLQEQLLSGTVIGEDSYTVSGLNYQADIFEAMAQKESFRFSHNSTMIGKIANPITGIILQINRQNTALNRGNVCKEYKECLQPPAPAEGEDAVEPPSLQVCLAKFKSCVDNYQPYKIQMNGYEADGYLYNPNIPSFLQGKQISSSNDLRSAVKAYIESVKQNGGIEYDGFTDYKLSSSGLHPLDQIGEYIVEIYEKWNFYTLNNSPLNKLTPVELRPNMPDWSKMNYLNVNFKKPSSVLDPYVKEPLAHVQAFYYAVNDQNIRGIKANCLRNKAAKIAHELDKNSTGSKIQEGKIEILDTPEKPEIQEGQGIYTPPVSVPRPDVIDTFDRR